MLRAKLSTVNGALRSFSNASNADLSRSSSASSGGTHRLNSAPHPRVRVARAPAAAVREGESPEFGIDAHPSASLPGTVPRRAMAEWRVVCSCGWTWDCSSEWAARSASRPISSSATRPALAVIQPPSNGSMALTVPEGELARPAPTSRNRRP